MATRYWVGSSGNWSDAANHWSASTGGAPGAANLPTSADDVVFDQLSNGVLGTSPFTVTVDTTANCLSFSTSSLDATMTLAGTAALNVYGSFTLPSTNFTLSYTGLLTFRATATNRTITAGGKTFGGAITFNHTAGVSYTLQDALTCTSTVTLTAGTVGLNNLTLTCNVFASTGTGTRVIGFGTTGKITVTSTASGSTIVSMATMTNLTFTGTSNITISGASTSGTRTVSMGTTGGSATNALSLNITAGSGTSTIAVTGWVRNLNFTGSTVTLANNTLSIVGLLTLVAGTTLAAGTSAVTFASTGSQSITSLGKTFDFPVTFDGVGGTFTLQDALTLGSARTATLTNGTLDLNDFTLTCQIWSSSNSNTRSISFDTTGKILIPTTTTTTVVSMGTLTNFTFTGTSNITLSGAASAVTRTVVMGTTAGSATNALSLNITAGSDTISLQGWVRNLNFTGSTVTLSNNVLSIVGTLTLTAGMTLTAGANAVTFASTGSQSITSLSKTFDFPVTFNGVGGTFTLQDALTIGATRTTTLTNGTLALNNLTLTTGIFSSTNSNTRAITFGSTGSIAIILTTTATVIDMTIMTGFSYTGTSTVTVNGVMVTGTRTIIMGTTGGTESNALSLSVTAGAGSLALTGVYDNLILNGFTGTLTNAARTIYGLLTLNSGYTITAGASATTFAASSGTQYIVTNGISITFPITVNSPGATFQLQSAITLTGANGTFTLTAGTLDLNSYTLTANAFDTSNANVRSLYLGTGDYLVVTGTSFTHRNDTNLTVNGDPTVYVTNLTTLSTDTQKLGIKVSSACPSITVNTLVSTPYMSILDLDLSNWAINAAKQFDINGGGYSDKKFTIYGNLTMNSGNTIIAGGPNGPMYLVFAGIAATTKTISAGLINCATWFDDGGLGASWQLASNIVCGQDASTSLGGTSFPFYFYRGTLYSNDYNVTFKRINVASGFTLYMGSGTWTSNNASTVNGQDMIIINSTTCYAQTCSISTTNTANVTSVANLYNITTDPVGGIIYLKSASANVNSLVSSAGNSVFYMCNTTFANLYLTGTASLPCTLARANTTATLTLTQTTGTAFVEHCNINSTSVTGGAEWRGQNCTNANNTGWTIITDQKTYGQNGFFGFLTGL